jgi:hypothetical protein
MEVQSADGSRIEVGPGHNARVVGEEMCVALDITIKQTDD